MTSSLQKKSPKERLPLFLSFALPFLIACVSQILAGIWPFDDGMMLAHDGWHQYYPFFRDFRDKLLSGGSLQYTWTVGAGTGYLSLFAYYLASPLNLLSVLVPEAYLTELFAVLTILKLALAGLFFGIFLKIVYRKNNFAIPFFALLYAFCAWACGYYWNIMWLDTFALLPLLIAGMVCLLREGKFRLYITALALSLWCCYYTAFFSCIFVLLCFIGYCICCPNGFKGFVVRFLRIGICTLIGVGIAAVLLIPTLMSIQTTYSATGKEVELLALNIAKDATGITNATNGLWTVFKEQTLPGLLDATRQTLAQLMPPPEITKMTGLPNIFCGFSTVMLSFCFLCCKKIKLREKIFHVLLLAFLLLSFFSRQLDYIWHGFHFPNMLPYRFSFLFSFVLIAMAYRAWLLMDDFNRKYLFAIIPLSALLIANLYGRETGENAFLLKQLGEKYASLLVWALSCLVFVGMVVYFLFYSKKRKKLMTVFLLLITTCEAVLCLAAGVNQIGTTTRSVYPKEKNNVKALLNYAEEQEDDLFWRTEVTTYQCLNDNALNGYNGVSIFTSSANVNFNRFSRALGLSSWPGSNRYAYYEGTPFANTMLGIKYLLDRDGNHIDTDYNTLKAVSGNANLLENTSYISLGFMTDSALADFVHGDSQPNLILEQERLFQAATGVEDSLYTFHAYSELEAEENCSFSADPTGRFFYYNTKDRSGATEYSVTYRIETTGLYCSSTKINDLENVDIYVNGERLFRRNIKKPSVFSLGVLRAGDELTFRYDVKSGKRDHIVLDVALMEREVYDRGMAALSDEPWKLTEFSDTRISGTIIAEADGLFYTSIPYEPGWTATVDGKPVALAVGYDPQSEEVALTDAVIVFPLSAGLHAITLTYQAPGLVLGGLISLGALLAFALLLFLRRRDWKLFPLESDVLPEIEAPEDTEEAEADGETEEIEKAPTESEDEFAEFDIPEVDPEGLAPISDEELLLRADSLANHVMFEEDTPDAQDAAPEPESTGEEPEEEPENTEEE